MKRIAIQGLIGSFHDIAAHLYFEDEQIQYAKPPFHARKISKKTKIPPVEIFVQKKCSCHLRRLQIFGNLAT